MSRSIPLLFLLAALSLASLVTPAFSGGIAIYRGKYATEPTLKSICTSQNYKFPYVIIGYLIQFGNGRTPVLSIANNYANIGQDIQDCQAHGVKVLLSIGGNMGSYSLSSSLDAKSVADYLWDNFLGGTSTTRPFGDAILDGIDFNIQLGSTGYYDDLAMDLARYREFREVYLTGAPNCSYPDGYLGPALDTGLFNAVWVQFYKDSSCAYDSEDISKIINSWNTWTSNANVEQIFLGATAHPPVPGYIESEDLIDKILPEIKKSAKYGGVTMSGGSPGEKTKYITKIISNV